MCFGVLSDSLIISSAFIGLVVQRAVGTCQYYHRESFNTLRNCLKDVLCAAHKQHLPSKPRRRCSRKGLLHCLQLRHQCQHLRHRLMWAVHSPPFLPQQSHAVMMRLLSSGAEEWLCCMMKIWHRFLTRHHKAALFYIAAQLMSGPHVRNKQCASITCQHAVADISPMVQVCFLPALLYFAFIDHFALHIGVMQLLISDFCMPTAVLTEHCRVWRA